MLARFTIAIASREDPNYPSSHTAHLVGSRKNHTSRK
jgi:hypothetical protein